MNGCAKPWIPAVPIFWRSRKIQRVVRSTFSAETLSCVDSLDVSIFLSRLIGEMLTANVGFKIPCGAVTDCKSLFSNCHSVTPNCEEKRLITDLAAIRECIERDDWRDLVWRPTEIQLADALTKPMDAHLLRQCLRTNEIPTRPYQKTKRERDAERKQQSQEKERELYSAQAFC